MPLVAIVAFAVPASLDASSVFSTGEQMFPIGWHEGMQAGEQCDRLRGQWNPMCALGLHSVRRDLPLGAFQIHFIRSAFDDFGPAAGRQQHQQHRDARLLIDPGAGIQGSQEIANLFSDRAGWLFWLRFFITRTGGTGLFSIRPESMAYSNTPHK